MASYESHVAARALECCVVVCRVNKERLLLLRGGKENERMFVVPIGELL